MAIRDIFKISRKTFFNPTGWIDLDYLRAQNRALWDILKGLFSPTRSDRTESFEEAMKRQGLTENDVQEAIKNYRFYAAIFVLCGALAFIYSFYLLFAYITIGGWCLGMAVTALFFVQAFKYDFWALQMKQRTLGLTFADWKRAILGDKGTS